MLLFFIVLSLLKHTVHTALTVSSNPKTPDHTRKLMNTIKWFTAKNNPVVKAFVQVVEIPDRTWEPTQNPDDAEVIFVYDSRVALLRSYRNDKIFCYLSSNRKEPNLPANVIHLYGVNALLEAPKLVEAVKTFQPKVEPAQNWRLPDEIAQTKGIYKILVVDDRPENLVFAQALLGAKHEVTVTDKFETAMELLKSEQFDYVLTDLELPGSLHYSALSPTSIDMTATYPYGFLIAFEATQLGLPVAIVTDGNHHSSWISAAFDTLKMSVINGKPVRFFNYIGKRWDTALQELERSMSL